MTPLILKTIGGVLGFFAIIVVIGFVLPDQQQVPSSTSEVAETEPSTPEEIPEEALVPAEVTLPEKSTLSVENSGLYAVLKVVDGDTFAISMNGVSETIRLIGVDTPETVDPRTTVQCFGKEASDATKSLLTGKKVKLEFDASQGQRDKYGRLLAYIYREDGLFVNQYLIENGYAHEYTYNTPYKYQTEFKAAERSAEASEKGLWAPGVCEPTTEPAPAIAPKPVPAVAPSGNYVCSSNTYNCGDFSTHDEAQSVYEMCGGVGNDIHKLDSDKDGEACESLP